MKQLNAKIWAFFFTTIMGVVFVNETELNVTRPIGKMMFDHSVLMGTMLKTESGNYIFNKG